LGKKQGIIHLSILYISSNKRKKQNKTNNQREIIFGRSNDRRVESIKTSRYRLTANFRTRPVHFCTIKFKQKNDFTIGPWKVYRISIQYMGM
jgi:hypothetical protein